MQDVVDEQLPIEICPEPQVPEDHPDYARRKYRFKFGQIYLSTPQLTEKDGTTDTMRPMVARLRNLTYNAPLFVDMYKTVFEVDEAGNEIKQISHDEERMFLGKIPIMLQSTYCVLKGQANKGLTDMGEWSDEHTRWTQPRCISRYSVLTLPRYCSFVSLTARTIRVVIS